MKISFAPACMAGLLLAGVSFGSASAAPAPSGTGASPSVQTILGSGVLAEWTQGRGRGFRGGGRRFGGAGFRGRGYGYGRGYGRGYGYRGGYGYRRGYGNGALVGAGIAGLATGALIGGALASQPGPGPGVAVNPEWIAYCQSKYRSFDPGSGTFLANDGQRYRCQ